MTLNMNAYGRLCFCISALFIALSHEATKKVLSGRSAFLDASPQYPKHISEYLWGHSPPPYLWKTEYDNFVAETGGVVDPAEDLPLFVPSASIWSYKNYFPKASHPMKSYIKLQKEQDTKAAQRARQGKRLQYRESLQKVAAGCADYSGFHFEGETWYSRGCRRHKCLYFRGKYFVETDSCDTEIYNTTYKCIVEADLNSNYPKCCPRYDCNPDNLGNRVNVQGGDIILK